jgi:hypothetical protein
LDAAPVFLHIHSGMLTAEEMQIVEFLKLRPDEFIPESEIGRRVGGKELFRANPTWAKLFLANLVSEGLVVMDDRGFYRCVQEAPPPSPATTASPAKKSAGKRWVSPHIASILKKSGKKFEILDTPNSEK